MIKNKLLFFITPLISGIILVCFYILILFLFPSIRFISNGITSGPFIEEILKFITILFLIIFFKYRSLSICIPFIGIGWGLVEGIAYYNKLGGRSFILILIHFIFALVMAFFLNKAINKTSRIKYLYYSLALIIPSLIHLGYNLFVSNL